MSNCNTCNTCNQPTRVCCCPPPAPTPVVPVVVCKSPLELLFEQTLTCYNEHACVNPINYTIEQAVSFTRNRIITPPEGNHNGVFNRNDVLTYFLTTGSVLPKCDLCCPKCVFGDGYIYLLTNAESFSAFVETFKCKLENICCININASTETFLTLEALPIDISSNLNCCNKFPAYVEELKNLTDCPIDLVNNGIVEYGSLGDNQESQLHNIALMFQTIFPTATATEYCNYITQFLLKGLVIYCGPNGMFIGSIETFTTYAEANNITCPTIPPQA